MNMPLDIISDCLKAPYTRESAERSLLSPIQKYSSSPKVMVKSAVNRPDEVLFFIDLTYSSSKKADRLVFR